MKIWVDADAFPAVLKEALFRAAERVKVPVVLVANHPIRVPPSELFSCLAVKDGFNAADDRIIAEIRPGDLVVTADVPLADRAITAGATALNPRGRLYTSANIKENLAMRNLLEELRGGSEIVGGGPAPFKDADRREFINQLDRLLTRYLRQPPVVGL